MTALDEFLAQNRHLNDRDDCTSVGSGKLTYGDLRQVQSHLRDRDKQTALAAGSELRAAYERCARMVEERALHMEGSPAYQEALMDLAKAIRREAQKGQR